MLMTSMAKKAADTGVPNRAAKQALMPDITRIRLSASSSFSTLEKVAPMLPPIWRAAPSLPLEPPHKWVSTEAVKMQTIFRRSIFPCSRTASSTRLVPLSL